MKSFNRLESALLALLFATALNVQNAQAASPSDLYARAKRAIASGNVVPERDLAPLIAVLRGPSSEEDLRSAIARDGPPYRPEASGVCGQMAPGRRDPAGAGRRLLVHVQLLA